jgi:hypothetical protein
LGKFLCKRSDTALHIRHPIPYFVSQKFLHYNLK